ncbi:MAG: hypothetical protein ACJ75B_01530 [Flavisolibacter sp.]
MKITGIILVLTLAACSSTSTHHGGYPDCNSKDIEFNDSCLLGESLRTALDKLGLDTSRYEAFGDSSSVLSGISSDSDSCQIELYVHNTTVTDTLNPLNYQLILDSPVIGLSWRKPLKDKERVLY